MLTISSIYAVAILNGLVLVAALVLNRRGDKLANRLLALVILLLMLALWNMYVDTNGLAAGWKTIDYYSWITPFFWGPALYLYVLAALGQLALSTSIVARHFSLGVAFILAEVLFHNLVDLVSSNAAYDVFNDLRLLGFYVHLGLYIFASFRLFAPQERDQHWGQKDAAKLSWLRNLILVFSVLLFIDLCTTVPAVFRQEDLPWLDVIMLSEAGTILLIGLSFLYHSGLTIGFVDLDKAGVKTKYAGSPIDTELSASLMGDLLRVMETDRPYLRNDLNLAALSDMVGASPYHMSQVINQQSGKNFYDFINGYRVNHAAKLLLLDPSVTITSIAFEAGFNNRVSFNTAFKKQFDMTPSVYRKSGAKIRVDAAE